MNKETKDDDKKNEKSEVKSSEKESTKPEDVKKEGQDGCCGSCSQKIPGSGISLTD